MACERQEVAAVVRDHDLHGGEAGNLGDVRVVNATAYHPFVLECSKEGFRGLLRELSNLEPSENLLLDQSERILGNQPEFLWKPGGDGVELQAACQAVKLRRICPPAIPVMIFCGYSDASPISMRPATRMLVSKNAGVSAATSCALPR